MGLRIGTQLAPYEILSAIGAGGMGEVYRARDTRLERIVAVKILPDHHELRTRSAELVLEGELEPELDLARRTEPVDPCSYANAVDVVACGSRSIDLPRSSRQ